MTHLTKLRDVEGKNAIFIPQSLRKKIRLFDEMMIDIIVEVDTAKVQGTMVGRKVLDYKDKSKGALEEIEKEINEYFWPDPKRLSDL
jgi:hypothetical protein